MNLDSSSAKSSRTPRPLIRAVGAGLVLGLVCLLLLRVAPVELVAAANGSLSDRPLSVALQVQPVLTGRVVAVGIPGIGAIGPVGTFHPGGPIHDKPEFAMFTAPGQILDPDRIFVAAGTNFGAPPAHFNRPGGSILSLDPRGNTTLVIPPSFAKGGSQSTAMDGRIRLFTSQGFAFLNGTYNAGAVTAGLPSVSSPTGISINNAFGRPWFTSTPEGASGPGLVSVIDPDGRPLAEAPGLVSGGVFSGLETNRAVQLIPGSLQSGVLANALMGKSPDGGGRAVFAAVSADGSVAQVHVEKGVDGLAPAGTIQPLTDLGSGGPTRTGVIFNWTPNPILYIADPLGNTIVVLSLADDGTVFRQTGSAKITASQLDQPIDLAPAVPEVANRGFSSNTTLAGGSDFYVANRGSGTIVRFSQDGEVIASRRIEVPGLGVIGPGRLNGIAVSPDAERIWVTISGPQPGFDNLEGAVVELPAFGDSFARIALSDHLDQVAEGSAIFRSDLSPEQGLGPLFNGPSCQLCHSSPVVGGMGPDGLSTVLRVGRLAGGRFDPMIERGGPVSRARSVAELGLPCRLRPGIPVGANVTSVRNAPPLFGIGLIDSITDETILAGAQAQVDGIHGRPNLVMRPDGSEGVGRFGWKASSATLEDFVGDAFRTELGITNPIAPNDLQPLPTDPAALCAGESAALEDDGTKVRAVTAYLASLPAPSPAASGSAGETVFRQIGCAACHTPALAAPSGDVALFSDLLVHDMGAVLDDGVVQSDAAGVDWRTTPLWGLGSRQRFLHDGRALTVRAAILAHDGEAKPAETRFRALPPDDLSALLSFLMSL